jgi:hypothetical protein
VTGPRVIATVGDLIARLSEFDDDAPIRVQAEVEGSTNEAPTDLVIGVSEPPDQPGVVVVKFLPSERRIIIKE